MKIEFLSLRRQYKSIKGEIDAAVASVIESGRFIMGENVFRLEEEIAEYIGTRYAVAVASGTDALQLSLMAFGVSPGDEVITTPFTFIATAEVIALLGARPVFVDIDPRTYCIDAAKIENAITERTKAIIPVHLFGQTVQWDPIWEIAQRHNLKVVEDGAQAIGAQYNGRKACSLGHLGVLSFFPSKNLGAYGDGGMITTDDEDLAQKIRMMRVHGSEAKYKHKILGLNSRLDDLQAAILRVKLPYLERWNQNRQRNAALYDTLLKGFELTTPFCAQGNLHVYHQYSIRVKKRDSFQAKLKEMGIPTAIHYPVPLHLQEAFAYLGYRRGDLPVSEEVSREIISLPMYPELTEGEIKYIVARITEALS